MDVKAKKKASLSLLKEDEQYFVGESVLVIPIVERYKRYIQIHEDLCDEEWFTIETGYVENSSEHYKTGLERLGVFIRADTILTFADLPK